MGIKNNIIFLLIFNWATCLQAQSLFPSSEQNTGDTTLVSLSVQQFLSQRNLLPKASLQSVPCLKDLTQTLEEKKKISQWKKKVKFPKTSLSLDNYFIEGARSYLDTIQPQLYSNFHVKSSLKLANIPLNLSGNAVLLDGKINTQLSSFAIHFNQGVFQEQLQEKYLPNPDINSIFDKNKNPLDLSLLEKETLIKEAKFTFYQQVITSPQFKTYKLKMEHQLDSLQMKMDTLTNTVQDSMHLEEWQAEMNQLQKIEKAYQKYWAFKTQVNNHSLLKGIQQKANNYKSKIVAQGHPESVKKELLQEHSLSIQEKFLLLTKHLDVGLFHIHDSEFTTHNTVLKGARYGWEALKNYGDIAYGSQALNASFLPSSSSSIFNRYYGRRFLFFRGGWGNREKDFAQISFLRIQDSGQDSVFTLPKSNVVVDVSGGIALAKNIDFLLDVAISHHSLSNTGTFLNFDTEQATTEENLAVSFKGAFQLQENVSFQIGYFSIGNQFRSLGNPFLLIGRQGISVDLKSQLLSDKLHWNTSLKYGFHITTENSQNFKDFQLSTELIYKFGSQNAIIARYLPGFYLQNGYAEQVTSQSNIYSIQANLFSQIAQNQLISIINVTNLKNDFQFADSLTTNELTYLYAQEMLLISNRHSVDVVLSVGSKYFSLYEIQDFLGQATYQIHFKQMTIGTGFQLLKQQFYPHLRYGWTLNTNMQLFKSLSLGFNFNYRNNFNPQRFSSDPQIIGNLSLRVTL